MKRLLPILLFVLIAGFSAWMLMEGDDAPTPGAERPTTVEEPAAVEAKTVRPSVESSPSVERHSVDVCDRQVDVGGILPIERQWEL